MVKIKVLSRSHEHHTRETTRSLDPIFKNPDPVVHPFEEAREYGRALNATKLSKLFAKPFLGVLGGHADGVYSLKRHPKDVQFVCSGSGDGEIRLWHVPSQKTRWRVAAAHRGMVRGLCYGKNDLLLSVGTDKLIKCWDPNPAYQSLASRGERFDFEAASHISSYVNSIADYDTEPSSGAASSSSGLLDREAVSTWTGEETFACLDHQQIGGGGPGTRFATGAGDKVHMWSYRRSEPVQEYSWGHGSITSLSFNRIETDVLAATTSDREVIFYDVRGSTPIRKLTLAMRSNVVAWNPMEAFNFAVANDDHNCYSFDVRNLSRALKIHTDHVGPVTSLDFSPTGEEFVTGSYDRTLRIFIRDQGKSREVYHTKRMQRIFAVQFTGDARFVLSASDDANVRIWKSEAAAPMGMLTPREKRHLSYTRSLQERYKHVPELRRIAHHRHVPKPVLKAQRLKQVMKEARRRKQQQIHRHSKPGDQRAMLAKETVRVVIDQTSK